MTSTVKDDAASGSATDFSIADDAIVTLQIQLPDDHFRKFHVHESLLCRASPVFQTALHGRFGEASSKTIDVKDTRFTTLDEFVFWLYRGKCPQQRGPDLGFLRYARLNSFAEKYDIAILKYDAAVNVVERVDDQPRYGFGPYCRYLVNEVYSHTRPGDYFRTLIVAIYVYRVEPEHFRTVDSAQYLERYPEFAVDVASAMGRRIAGLDTIKFDASTFIKPGSRSDSKRNTRLSTDVTRGPDELVLGKLLD